MNRAQLIIHKARRAFRGLTQVLTRGAGYESGAAPLRQQSSSFRQ
jgi:hypothetical protein